MGPLSEYLLKGIYLGLLLFAALREPDLKATGLVTLCTAGGLAIAIAVSAVGKIREGFRVQGRWVGFILFLLLESSFLVYTGIILGTLAGVYLAVPRPEGQDNWPLMGAIGGGAVLGLAFCLLRLVRNRYIRLGLSVGLAIALMAGGAYFLGQIPDVQPAFSLTWVDPTVFGVQLLLGIPIFYMLTFAGAEEESEVEVGAICAALGIGLAILAKDHPSFQSTIFLFVLLLYFFYTTRVLPGLRVFKHSLRGFTYAKVGKYRQALLSFRRARQLDPANSLAREGLWRVHRSMDLAEVAKDPHTLALIDYELCLERVSSLLLQPGPSLEKLEESHHLLHLVLNQRPIMRPVVDYWRAVAHTHARLYDRAAEDLANVLDSTGFSPNDPYRLSVLLSAWQLALTLRPELNQRVGTPQLGIPGRRMEAIAACERHLAENPQDASIWELKRILYSGLTEAEYSSRISSREAPGTFSFGALAGFDYGYAQQLGLALVSDSGRWRSGVEYLRMALRGLPAQGPSICQSIAQAYQRSGDTAEAHHYLELAKQAGRLVGPKNLPEEEKQTYFAILKQLGETARAAGNHDAAIENFLLFAENERSGVETLRTLAELYERKGDPLSAVRATEQALIYNAKDKDLLERKDRYYFSLNLDDLRVRPESAFKGLDVDYCLKKAKSVLDLRDIDLDQLDWGSHLAELALVIQPANLTAKVLCARAQRRRGEIEACQKLLEDVYQNKPAKFASGADEEAWYLACRLLGDMYLNELSRPDLAVPCFQDYRKSSKSGADTLYKLGQAFEQVGDRKRAAKCYEHVTSYDSHPLAPDARDALYRLQSQ